MKKKIGISDTGNIQNYIKWFTEDDLGGDVELVKLKVCGDIKACDGFILTGGIDVDPSLYKGEENYKNKLSTDLARDKFEAEIFSLSQQRNAPLLGICRGLQLVNVLLNGKLIQDLDENNELHRKENNKDKHHGVTIENATLLSAITGSSEGGVNSAHHQAVDPDFIGDNLKVNAYSNTPDRTIEGLEFNDKTGKAFMLCVQWHPERMEDKEKNGLSRNIKERFLEEIRKAF